MSGIVQASHRQGARASCRRFFAGSWVPIAILLAIWEVVAVAGWIPARFLPAFHQVIAALFVIIANGELGANLAATLSIAFAGLLVATVIGVLLGTGMALNRWMDRLFGPLVAATYSLPKTALIPLLILWFGIGGATNLLVVVLGCLLPILASTYQGVTGVPQTYIWGALAMGAKRHRILLDVILPAAAASIVSGVRIGLGYCFVLVISAEMIATRLGIGKLIFLYGESGTYDYMLAGILCVVAVAYAADRGLIGLSGKLLHWEESHA